MRKLILAIMLASASFACSVPSVSLPLLKSSPPSGSVLFKDEFSSPASGWDRTKYAAGMMDYDRGGYRIMVNALESNIWSSPHKDFNDVRIEVDAGKLAGPDENRIGIFCRSNGSRYYFFIIGSDGFYGVGIFNNGQAALLGQTEMKSSTGIITGTAINHLRADCSGDNLSFHVNGSLLSELHDSTLTHGDVGLLAGTFDKPGVDIVFDHFIVLQP